MQYIKKISNIIKMSKDTSNVPIDTCKKVVEIKWNQSKISCRKEDTSFSSFFLIPNEVKYSIYITDGVIIKSVIS